MGFLKIEVSPGYLHGVQEKAKEAISILCQKDALAYEDARAIRLMSETIGCLNIDVIRRFQRDRIEPFAEDYNRCGAVPDQPDE